ncbi:LlaMI family restriction endonuclease [Clostridium sp. YIM B02569]|uniref:LlaMI family restriction endonuclease n=1 Tax=Clostridium sp. YIM B02569 TaxID=2911967 RepID=UPI001EEA632E|nr:LlaMI family restriction endonuclease [Clostridium sp. YIM B02569]
MTAKKDIIALFNKNVKGKKPNTDDKNVRHDGREGHWLEQQFGITANADNEADLMGYELKNETTSKTTFGDWSANEYIFTMPNYKNLFVGKSKCEKQNSFIKIFGRPNTEKEGRYSWSGTPCPKIGDYNTYGQRLEITGNKDIIAVYSYLHDKRENKSNIIPTEFQKEKIIVARWYGESTPIEKCKDKCLATCTKKRCNKKCLKKKLEDKFNDKGWFTCKKDDTGTYVKICFGKPMNYDEWIKLVKDGTVFFDSGMYEGNSRPYSQWRANNNYWNSLITEEYE